MRFAARGPRPPRRSPRYRARTRTAIRAARPPRRGRRSIPTAESSALEPPPAHRDAEFVGERQQSPHPAERSDLHDRDVRSAGPHDPQRVLGAADALVGGDPHVGQPPADASDQLGHGRARLFGVLERTVGGQGAQRGARPRRPSIHRSRRRARSARVRGPPAPARRRRRESDRVRPPSLSRSARRGTGEHVGHPVGVDRGDGGVDRHPRRARAGGGPSQASSIADRSQCAASSSAYSGNGANSPHPAGPRSSNASRVVMPRNRTRMGRLTTTASARTSSHGGQGRHEVRAARAAAGASGPRSRRATCRRVHQPCGDERLAPLHAVDAALDGRARVERCDLAVVRRAGTRCG